jgi:hypothetical protein
MEDDRRPTTNQQQKILAVVEAMIAHHAER